MTRADANPFIVALLIMARCLIPLFIMLAITYLLQRFGMKPEPLQPPTNDDHVDLEDNEDNKSKERGTSHG